MVKQNLGKLLRKGFFHVLFLGGFSKIIQFISNIVMVRILSKEDFGLMSYVQNILSLLLLLNGGGSVSGFLQYGSESTDSVKQYSLFKYGMYRGLVFSFLVSVLILGIALIVPLKVKLANELLVWLLFYPPLIFVFSMITLVFRVSLNNNKYVYISIFSSVVLLLFSVWGACVNGVWGVFQFKYAGYIISVGLGLYWVSTYFHSMNCCRAKSDSLCEREKKSFNHYSWYSLATNVISQLLYIIDILLIGEIVTDRKVIASYKVATTIPFSLIIIPLSVMVFAYPYFARRNSNKIWIKKSYLKILSGLALFNLGITVLLFIFARFTILVIFGIKYVDAVIVFRILIIGYFISGTFRIPAGNILASMRKVKFGLYTSVFAGIINIVLDIFMIKQMGSIGAAISTVTIFLITSMLNVGYLFYCLKEKNTGGN